jgi:hypothetical protein
MEKKKKGAIAPPKIIKNPITLQEHLDVGFVTMAESESKQEEGEKVKEIKVIEGKTLHRLEK